MSQLPPGATGRIEHVRVAQAYLGSTVRDFPDLFFLAGPNTGPSPDRSHVDLVAGG